MENFRPSMMQHLILTSCLLYWNAISFCAAYQTERGGGGGRGEERAYTNMDREMWTYSISISHWRLSVQEERRHVHLNTHTHTHSNIIMIYINHTLAAFLSGSCPGFFFLKREYSIQVVIYDQIGFFSDSPVLLSFSLTFQEF